MSNTNKNKVIKMTTNTSNHGAQAEQIFNCAADMVYAKPLISAISSNDNKMTECYYTNAQNYKKAFKAQKQFKSLRTKLISLLKMNNIFGSDPSMKKQNSKKLLKKIGAMLAKCFKLNRKTGALEVTPSNDWTSSIAGQTPTVAKKKAKKTKAVKKPAKKKTSAVKKPAKKKVTSAAKKPAKKKVSAVKKPAKKKVTSAAKKPAKKKVSAVKKPAKKKVTAVKKPAKKKVTSAAKKPAKKKVTSAAKKPAKKKVTSAAKKPAKKKVTSAVKKPAKKKTSAIKKPAKKKVTGLNIAKVQGSNANTNASGSQSMQRVSNS